MAVVPLLLLAVAGVVVALLYVRPAPPKRLVLAIAPDEGGSRYYARRYREILERDDIALEVKETSGSRSSVGLLAKGEAGADVAFVQGGSAPQGDAPPTRLFSIDGKTAFEELKRAEIDALFLVAPAESPMVKRLAVAPGIRLVSVAHAEAYTRLLPFLTRLVLPRGIYDVGADIPEVDTLLISPTAKQIELDLEHEPAEEKLVQMLRRLDEIERSVNHMPTPLSYAENLYSFRGGVALVRQRILRQLSEGPGAARHGQPEAHPAS